MQPYSRSLKFNIIILVLTFSAIVLSSLHYYGPNNRRLIAYRLISHSIRQKALEIRW